APHRLVAYRSVPGRRVAAARRARPSPPPGAAGTARARDLPGRLHRLVRAAADQQPERARGRAEPGGPELLCLGVALVALCRVALGQPAVLAPDRGTGRLRPGVDDHLASGGSALVAGHGPVRPGDVVQPDAAARAAGLGLGGLRRRAPADRPVLARA